MKTDIISKMSHLSRALLIATLALAGAASVKAQNFFDNTIDGTVNLGNASGGSPANGHNNWAIFSLSGNVTITDPTPYTPGSVPSYDVIGNIGIAGSGKLSMTDSYADGYVSENTLGSSLAGNGANPYFKGTIGVNSALITFAHNDAIAASAAAAALTATPGTVTTAVFTSGKTEADLGITGPLAGNTYVLNLTDLILQGTSAILTLHGTATTNYIINIDRYMSLSGGAQINLSGGLTAANVLYNVNQNSINHVQYDVTLSGGSQATGIILATTRAVKQTGASVVNGEVIAQSVSLSGASKVINPFASP